MSPAAGLALPLLCRRANTLGVRLRQHRPHSVTTVIALASTLALSPPARAETISLTTPTTLTADRSEASALLVALAGTLLPTAGGATMIVIGANNGNSSLLGGGIALAGFGLTLGPSMGHFYAGEVEHGGLMALARAGLILAGFGGVAFAGMVAFVAVFDGDEGDATGWIVLGFVAAAVCGLATIGLGIADMIDAPAAVRRRLRRRLRQQRKRRGLASLQIVPVVAKSEHRGSLVGLSAAMRF